MENVLKFLVDNWYLIIAAIGIIFGIVLKMKGFSKLPTEEQIKSIKEWLLMAVAEAEAQLGSGTGELKLRMVYDMFVERFPSLALIVPFEMFSAWVDDALTELEELLKTNSAVKSVVIGEDVE